MSGSAVHPDDCPCERHVQVRAVHPDTGIRSCNHKIHGLTCDDYNALFRICGARCSVCERAPVLVGPLVIDHDHQGAVGDPQWIRGLLCRGCNVHLQSYEESPEAPWTFPEPGMWAFMRYLASPPAHALVLSPASAFGRTAPRGWIERNRRLDSKDLLVNFGRVRGDELPPARRADSSRIPWAGR
ncbi:endonuclease domain-containing protein [Kitasatospora sp. NPDC094028]